MFSPCPTPLPTPYCGRAEKSSSSQGLQKFWTEQTRLTYVLAKRLCQMTTLPSKFVAISCLSTMHSKIDHLQACHIFNAVISVSDAALYTYVSIQQDLTFVTI